jgi:hypothetical protein
MVQARLRILLRTQKDFKAVADSLKCTPPVTGLGTGLGTDLGEETAPLLPAETMPAGEASEALRSIQRDQPAPEGAAPMATEPVPAGPLSVDPVPVEPVTTGPVRPVPAADAPSVRLGRNLPYVSLGSLRSYPAEPDRAPEVVDETGEPVSQLWAVPLGAGRVKLVPADGTLRRGREGMVVSAVSGELLEATVIANQAWHYWRIDYRRSLPEGVLINEAGEVVSSPAQLTHLPNGAFRLIWRDSEVAFEGRLPGTRAVNPTTTEPAALALPPR